MTAVLRHLPEADFRSAAAAGLAGLHDLEVLAQAGLYLFVLPYATKWRSRRRTD